MKQKRLSTRFVYICMETQDNRTRSKRIFGKTGYVKKFKSTHFTNANT